MPYYISDQQADCAGWATIMAETPNSAPEIVGCHQTKQDAIDQMVAASISEGMEPAGDWATRDYVIAGNQPEMESPVLDDVEEDDGEELLSSRQQALYETYEAIAETFGSFDQGTGANGAHYVAESPFADEGLVCSNCVFYEGGRICEIVTGDIAPEGICKLWIINEELVTVRTTEQRAVDLSAPDFMRENARRGLEYHEEGLSGDGLQPQTVEDARAMASGDISEVKWRKIAPWIARHMVDLEAADGEITAGVVAHLLWGSGTTKEAAQRTMDYAQNIIDRLDAEEESRTAGVLRENRWVISNKDARSIAYTNLELRAMDDSEDGWTVSGYAAVFDSPSEPLPWTEYVKRGAFRKTIKDGADVRLLIDHTGVPLARTKSGTLKLREDDRGLFMEAKLDPNNPDAVKMRSALMRGDVSQMSFAFETVKDAWNKDRTVRELKEVRLYDVSIVTYPAYEETSAEIRNSQPTDTTVATVQSISLRKAQVMLAKAKAVR